MCQPFFVRKGEENCSEDALRQTPHMLRLQNSLGPTTAIKLCANKATFVADLTRADDASYLR